MKEQLMEILGDLRPDVDFENEKQLITDGVLDSFDVVSMVGALNDEFDIEIGVADLVPDNFNSVDSIIALIERLQDE
ncbi:acyl carrier protein [Ruminococcus sp. YE71]|uniref:acyl carrier protein n=1 Tax=unclassified Ruminococcus TaxID=2608920 RepID=UPI000887F0B8|nr:MULTISPECIES: phosphopantetheine-binding protein [unclassified Ruminococcus]SDA16702.1 acyl carrier protein [Ruminococcus sp. YE78]SFW25510.1 acyl carrier protein [Ruminococcus sp. YE71]